MVVDEGTGNANAARTGGGFLRKEGDSVQRNRSTDLECAGRMWFP